MTDQTQKFVATWTEDKRFTDGVALVVVKRSNHHRTRYSYEILFQNQPDRASRFTFLKSGGEGSGKIVCAGHVQSIVRAVTSAEEYIRDMYQAQEDAEIERREARERASLDRDKLAVKPGLKTLAKADAARRAS